MNWSLPFGDGTLTELAGRRVVLAENHRNDNLFVPVRELSVGGGGDCEKGWGFEVVRGTLRLMREGNLGSRSCLCEFRGLECRGGAVYAVGNRLDVEAKHGFGRTILYEKKLLTPDGCGVCVSSHIAYESKTLEPILKSIKKTGFDMKRVVVMVDGDPKWDGWADDRGDGVIVLRSNADAMGFAGLLAVDRASQVGPEYWLLVHDTCEFERDFVGKMSKIDIGLGPDMVLLSPPSTKSEIGFYRSDFVASCGVDIKGTKPDGLFDAFMRRAMVVMVADGKTEVLGTKDVYGTGNSRKVVRMASVGLRKFAGSTVRGGRP